MPVAVRNAVRELFSSTEVARRPHIEGLEGRQLLSSTWYVSPSGSNGNPGSLAAPFQTIQQAANVAGPGDHVEIEAGTYRETVTPKNSGSSGNPIVFEAYNGENVTVSGANPITGWSDYSGSIYDASMPWDLGEGNNEVFVNGSAINEAMWPNTGIGNFSHPGTTTIQSSSVHGDTAVIYDSALSQPAGTWTGAIIHMDPGQAWEDQTGVVTSSSPGSVTINFNDDGADHQPVAGNQFYLFGKFKALDTAGEWYRDPSTGKLYAWMPNSGNPAGEDVEAKERLYAFNLSGKSNITLHGVNIFAAGINTSGGSSNIVINGMTAQYVSQSLQITAGWWIPPSNDGIDLMGPNDIIENSTVAYASNDGIVLGGSGSVAENNVVHDVAYTGSNTAGIRLLAGGDTVTHNTIYNSGRHGVLAEEPHSTVTYNTIHDVGLQTTEAGGIYTANTNGEGAVMAYNQIYNIHTPGYGGTALFTDNNSSNWVVHNNITWNVDYSLKMNFTSNNNLIYNNTMGATKLSINTDQDGNWDGTKIYNNIFEAPVVFTPGGSEYNNATSAGSANSSQGAGSFSSGANGVISVTPPVTTTTVSTPPVTTPPVTTPPVTTPPTTTTPLATSKVMAVNYNSHLNTQGDTFGGVGYIYTGSYVAYTLNFGTGVSKLTAAIAGMMPGTMQIRLGSPTGTLLGTLNTAATGAWNNYTAQSTAVSKITGTQTVYFVFSGWQYGVCNIDWLQFS